MPDDAPAADRLDAFLGWRLCLACACGRSCYVPVRLLVREHGPDASAAALARRMRCGACRARPVSVDLIEDPQREAPGYCGGGPSARRPILPAP